MNYYEYISTGGVHKKEVVPEKFIPKMIYNIKKIIKNTKDEYLATVICVPIFLFVYAHLFGADFVLSFLGIYTTIPLLMLVIFLLSLIQQKSKRVRYRDQVYVNSSAKDKL